jgi:hypothetical protein
VTTPVFPICATVDLAAAMPRDTAMNSRTVH